MKFFDIIFFIFIILLIIILIIYTFMWWKANTVTFSDIDIDCKYRRFGCCPDDLTPKLDTFGSNCRGF